MYLKATSVPRLNALENGDFLNFIFYFLADKHEQIHTHQPSLNFEAVEKYPLFFSIPPKQQQDVSPMSQNDSKRNVPYEALWSKTKRQLNLA